MYKLAAIADLVGGTVKGDPEFCIREIRSLYDATPDSITFFADKSLEGLLGECDAGAMLVSEHYAGGFGGNLVVVSDPYLAYARVSSLFEPDYGKKNPAISPTATVRENSSLGDNVTIGEHSTVEHNSRVGSGTRIGSNVFVGEGVTIGEDAVVESNVTIHHGTVIGDRCCISPGAVIGSSGFGYAPDGAGWKKISQLGKVVIGDDVDIGANTTIDRGAIGNTVVEDGVKLDNHIQIAHNVVIGENSIIAACAGIAGSTRIGKRCRLGGRTNILGHIEICDDVTIQATSFVAGSIDTPGEYSAALPAQPAQQWRRNVALIRRLQDLARTVRQLAKVSKQEE